MYRDINIVVMVTISLMHVDLEQLSQTVYQREDLTAIITSRKLICQLIWQEMVGPVLISCC